MGHQITAPVQAAAERVAAFADRIRAEFKADAKITIIVRRPDDIDGSQDFVLTDDNLDLAVAVIRRRQADPKSIVGTA